MAKNIIDKKKEESVIIHTEDVFTPNTLIEDVPFPSFQTSNEQGDYFPPQTETLSQEKSIQDYLPNYPSWWLVPHLRQLIIWCAIISITSQTGGYDFSFLNAAQALSFWGPVMGNPTGTKLGVLTNAYIFGSILSFPIAPFVCDKYGRKIAVAIGSLGVVIGAVLQGSATNYIFFFFARLVMGFSANIGLVSSPALISEISYPTHRTTATCAYNVNVYGGAILASVIGYLCRDIQSNYSWKIPAYLQGLLPFIQLCFIFWIPESPRFLVATGQVDKARAILSKYHIGDSTDSKSQIFLEFELKEIEESIELEKTCGTNTKYSDFWTRKTYRKRLFIVILIGVILQLSGNGLVSYYLNKVLKSIGYTDVSQILMINIGLMVFNYGTSAIASLTSNYFKRRAIFNVSLIGMGICYVIWTLLSALNVQRNYEDRSMGAGVLAMVFLYNAFYNTGCIGLPFLYIVEVLPYSHRAKGMNIFAVTMYIILLYNGFVNPIAMDAIDWKYYIVFCCVIWIEFVLVFLFFPETSGRTLEEVAEVFGDVILVEKSVNDVEKAETSAATDYFSYNQKQDISKAVITSPTETLV